MAISLKAARVNAGLTLAEASEKIGVSKKTLIDYEKQRRFPNVRLAQKIAMTYGCRYDDIEFSCPEDTL